LVKGYQKIAKFCEVIAYFATTEWLFLDGNTQKLWNKMTSKDQELFYFQMKDVNWREIIEDNCKAVRVYIVKDPLSTIPAARKRRIM